MDPLTIAILRTLEPGTALPGALHCQITTLTRKETAGGKPYLQIEVADGNGSEKLSVWSDSPAYPILSELADNSPEDLKKFPAFHELQAEWTRNQYGINAKFQGAPVPLTAEQVSELLSGDPDRAEVIEQQFLHMADMVLGMEDPHYRTLCKALLDEKAEPICRAAAARGNHHARRGGLVEHTCSMMRAAVLLSPLYPHIRADLLLAGALWHDMGKLFENQYEPGGFAMPYSPRAELYGHIAMGVLMVRELWARLDLPASAPDNHRLHLLCHLILSHHGTLEWGSPVEPKIPEALLLHAIDNMDAKQQMYQEGAAKAAEVAPGVLDRIYPLRIHPVTMTF